MEKRNVVEDKRTPCKICENGHSEYVCPKCKGTKQADEDTRLNPEDIAEAHK